MMNIGEVHVPEVQHQEGAALLPYAGEVGVYVLLFLVNTEAKMVRKDDRKEPGSPPIGFLCEQSPGQINCSQGDSVAALPQVFYRFENPSAYLVQLGIFCCSVQ